MKTTSFSIPTTLLLPTSLLIPTKVGIHLLLAAVMVLGAGRVGFGQVEVEWEQIGQIEVANILQDNRIEGVAFDGTNFYYSGANDADPNTIYVTNREGELINSFVQPGQSNFGMNDLEWDGELLWGSGEARVFGFDTEGNIVHQFQGPFNPSTRSVAYDSDRDILWLSRTTSSIVGCSREGEAIGEEFDSKGLRITGLAYMSNDPQGYQLYVLTFPLSEQSDNFKIYKINLENGDTLFVQELQGISGGAFISQNFIENQYTIMVTFNRPIEEGGDLVRLYDITPPPIWINTPDSISIIASDEAFVDISGGSRNENAELSISYSSDDIPENVTFEDFGNGKGNFSWRTSQQDVGRYTAEFTISDGELDTSRIVHFQVNMSFRIPLRAGWNMISSVCPPANPAIPTVWSEVVGRGNLTMAKNQTGQFYRPGVFNNMAPWDVRQGYMAKLSWQDTLVIVNVPVPEDTPIPLRQGWNLIAYFPEDDLDVRDALAGIADDVLLVKDINGRFYRPANNFSNMPPLSRGNGYQVAVSQAVELVYPGGGEVVALASSRHVPPPSGRQNRDFPEMPEELAARMAALHFHPITLTGANMSMLLTTLLPAEAAIHSSEIAVFTESGLCVGSTGVSAGQTATEGGATVGLAVWADDPTTPEIDGAVEGEALTFRLWNGQAETPVLLNWSEGDGTFKTDAFSCASLNAQGEFPLSSFSFQLSPAFPNPFNSTTLIRFDLPQSGKVSLTITDLAGRQVADLMDGYGDPSSDAAGNHSVVWNASNQPTGVYLVKLSTFAATRTQKVVLVR